MRMTIARTSGGRVGVVDPQPHPRAVQMSAGYWEIDIETLDDLLEIVNLTTKERIERGDAFDGVLIYQGNASYTIFLQDSSPCQ